MSQTSASLPCVGCQFASIQKHVGVLGAQVSYDIYGGSSRLTAAPANASQQCASLSLLGRSGIVGVYGLAGGLWLWVMKGSCGSDCLLLLKSGIFEFGPRSQIRRDYPLNLSISLSGGKETNQDSPSNGE